MLQKQITFTYIMSVVDTAKFYDWFRNE